MHTEYKGCSRCIVTATRPEERPIWERATIEISEAAPVTLELHAPDGGWVKGTDDTNSIIVPQDTVALRFHSAAELRELARLCEHMASRLEFIERATHVAMGGSVALVCKHSVQSDPNLAGDNIVFNREYLMKALDRADARRHA